MSARKFTKNGLGIGLSTKQEQTHAFVLAKRQARMFFKLKKLLQSFGISKFYADKLKTYERHPDKEERTVSKDKMLPD